MSEDSPRGNLRLMRIGFVLLGIASFGGLLAMVLIGVEKVRTGHGLDTYRTAWLVEFNWIGFLVLLAATVVALLAGAYLRYLEWREIRQLQARYRDVDRPD
jgi:hypothetical protein